MCIHVYERSLRLEDFRTTEPFGCPGLRDAPRPTRARPLPFPFPSSPPARGAQDGPMLRIQARRAGNTRLADTPRKTARPRHLGPDASRGAPARPVPRQARGRFRATVFLRPLGVFPGRLHRRSSRTQVRPDHRGLASQTAKPHGRARKDLCKPLGRSRSRPAHRREGQVRDMNIYSYFSILI